MPKVGMEPKRRSALVEATILEIGRAGSLDVTVSQIAKQAGMSSALAHHYFGSKDEILTAAMRHILSVFGANIRKALSKAQTPHERLSAIIGASFAADNFSPEVIGAWLSFYVRAQNSQAARRLLRVYHKRLHSNLVYNLKPLTGQRADSIATTLGALIDGFYIRQALGEQKYPSSQVPEFIGDYLENAIENAHG